jgi:hypothetical protein
VSIDIAALGGLAAVSVLAAQAWCTPFATTILDYTPAPGQFINDPALSSPAYALGAPVGGGTSAPNNSEVVSLGGFGGSITLGFAETIYDDPRNPYGLDATVFGNAFWVGGDPTRRFAEGGIIEISRDVNGNGIADDSWYVIPGSSLPSPPAAAALTQHWDNDPNTPVPPANLAWYPDPQLYPHISSSYSTSGYLLPAAFQSIPLVHPDGATALVEVYRGYADLSPVLVLGDLTGNNIVDDPSMTPEQFYTRPDNPFLVGVDPGSGGGDAFDIAWAVDPVTGEPANLDGFDFIRISTGANSIFGIFGEISTEISGVAAVSPDPLFYDTNADGVLDVEDLYHWHMSPSDLTGETIIDHRDRRALQHAIRHAETDDMIGVGP